MPSWKYISLAKKLSLDGRIMDDWYFIQSFVYFINILQWAF